MHRILGALAAASPALLALAGVVLLAAMR